MRVTRAAVVTSASNPTVRLGSDGFYEAKLMAAELAQHLEDSELSHRLREEAHQLKHRFAVAIAAALLGLAGCATSGGNTFFDDAATTMRVKKAIFNEPSLKVAEITVQTYKSAVQLSGFVGSNADIYTAGSLARSVKGVESVQNDLRLK